MLSTSSPAPPAVSGAEMKMQTQTNAAVAGIAMKASRAVSIDDAAAVMAMIGAAQNGCRVRCISYATVKDMTTALEKRLASMLLKRDWPGCQFVVDVHAQHFPTCYRRKGRPESTAFTVGYTKSGWKVIGVRRDTTHRRFRVISRGLEDKAAELAAFASSDRAWDVE